MLNSRLMCMAASMALCSATAQAQTYPAKPITVIVAFAAGGPVDLESRLYTTKASEIIGQPLVIEYKVGGELWKCERFSALAAEMEHGLAADKAVRLAFDIDAAGTELER